jgi:hypothetical protein
VDGTQIPLVRIQGGSIDVDNVNDTVDVRGSLSIER